MIIDVQRNAKGPQIILSRASESFLLKLFEQEVPEILEGIVTTLNEDQTVNVAPMGPIVDATMQTLLLRPFQTSTTYRNLKRTGCGVLHVTDDVLLLAQAAVGRLDPLPKTDPAERVAGVVLRSACRWYEFVVSSLDDREERTHIAARVVHTGRLRDFFDTEFLRQLHLGFT